jgi:hypothetical protein
MGTSMLPMTSLAVSAASGAAASRKQLAVIAGDSRFRRGAPCPVSRRATSSARPPVTKAA